MALTLFQFAPHDPTQDPIEAVWHQDLYWQVLHVMHKRIGISISIALLAGIACYWYQVTYDRKGGDITWPLCAAVALLQGHDPYNCSAGLGMPTNMLPTAIIVLPLVPLVPEVAASMMIGVSTGLLSWGLLREGAYWRLLMFLSFPCWQCVQTANWTILLVAIGFTPFFYPLLAVKPHAALPIAITRFSWPGVFIAVCIVGVAFIIQPHWPMRWWATAQAYSGGPLIIQFPLAIVVFAAALRWRQQAAQYLMLCAVAPLRAFYDYFLLFILPQTPRQLLVLVLCSWLAYFSWFFGPNIGGAGYIFIWLYIPCMVWVLRNNRPTTIW
jgi:hypothetical protein